MKLLMLCMGVNMFGCVKSSIKVIALAFPAILFSGVTPAFGHCLPRIILNLYIFCKSCVLKTLHCLAVQLHRGIGFLKITTRNEKMDAVCAIVSSCQWSITIKCACVNKYFRYILHFIRLTFTEKNIYIYHIYHAIIT